MRGRREQGRDRRTFNQPTGIHHIDPIRMPRNQPQIVCDQQHSGTAPGSELLDQFKDLRLRCHVERSGRLIGQQ